jgi:fatty acid desaturase
MKANLLGSFAFAVTGWLMGALGHDAGHFAASRWAIVNEYGVWAMSFICNPVMWQQQHTYGHHSFTNEFDRDPDLHHFDALLRVHKKFKYESRFKYQSSFLYVLFAYLFVVFGTCFWIPWGVLSEGTLYGVVDWHDKDRPTKFYGMVFHLFCYVGIVLLVPMYTHESFGKAALACYIHVGTLGITFALFSQINHMNEPSLESDMDSRQQRQEEKKRQGRDPRLATSWGAAQVETANNFASKSTFWHILSNGLNHQIEHHLFPALNHGHLHHIAPVVKQTCEEFGVEYKSYDTWSDLMNATLEWFDKLSVTDNNDIDDDVVSTAPGIKTIKIS